jgi:lipoprotein-anchoring transpeptidase ErfK/SrfK
MRSAPATRLLVGAGLALVLAATPSLAGCSGSASSAREVDALPVAAVASPTVPATSTTPPADVAPVRLAPADPIPADVRSRCPVAAIACVDTHTLVAWLQDGHGDIVYGPVPVQLGRPGHETPTGTFHVVWKTKHWTSMLYGVPMPWSVFFAAGGIGFHAGPLDEQSHGCVHLSMAAAQKFFESLPVHAEVFVA